MSRKHCIVSISGGLSSAICLKRALAVYGKQNVTALFADVNMEDDDLYRFLDDISSTMGHPIVRIDNGGRDVWDVFRRQRFLGNTRVDLCSRILKRQAIAKWVADNGHTPESTVLAIGLDWTEPERHDAVVRNWAPYDVWFPLNDAPRLSHCDKVAAVESWGIRPPRLYDSGFPHNNCGGFCVKAGQAQFAKLLEQYPERYRWHEAEEEALRRRLGKDVAILRDRRGGQTRPMTMAAFRERIEAGESFDRHDWGQSCDCMGNTNGTQTSLFVDGCPGEGE